MSKSELIKGPWFRIAQNDAGATVTVGDPQGVTVSVDVDEGELAFLLPIVEAWLKANDEDPFEDWVWDAKADVCRPANLQKLDDERGRLAERGVEIIFEEPWFRLYRDGGVPKLGIRTGLKDARKVELTEDEVGGIWTAVEESLSSKLDSLVADHEGDDGGPSRRRAPSVLRLPLVDRLVLEAAPIGWKPEAAHPAALNPKLVRPWNKRLFGDRVSSNDIDRIATNLGVLKPLILSSLGVKNTDEVETGATPELPSLSRRHPLSPFNSPSNWLVPWFAFGTVGGKAYQLRIAVFQGSPALTISGPEPDNADYRTRIETALKGSGFIHYGCEYVWLRPDCVFNDQQRSFIQSCFSLQRETRKMSELVSDAKKEWPLEIEPHSFEWPNGWEQWLNPIETIFRKTEWNAYEESFGDGIASDVRHELTPDEIMELVRAAALMHAADMKGKTLWQARRKQKSDTGSDMKADKNLGQIIYISKTDEATPSLYRQLDRMRRLVEAPSDEAAWERALEDYTKPGMPMEELILKLMGAALFERRCHGAVPPQYVDNPYWDWDPFAEDGDERIAEGRRTTDVARRIENEVAEVVASLGHAMDGTNADFVEACLQHGAEWTEAIEAAMDAILEKSEVEMALDEIHGSEKGRETQHLAGEAMAGVRLAWDCAWIWLEVTKDVVRPSPPDSSHSPRNSVGSAKNFNRFINLVSHAVEDTVEDAKDRVKKGKIGRSHVSRTKRALQGLRLQEQWLIDPPPAIAGNPMTAVDGRFIAYPPQGMATPYGPAGWRLRNRFTESVSAQFHDVTDPHSLKKNALEANKRPKRKKEEA